MQSKQSNTNQPVIASALLAVAFVVVTARERAYTEVAIERTPPAQRREDAATNQSHRWYEGLTRAVDRRLVQLFYCALPGGLEPNDLDISKL